MQVKVSIYNHLFVELCQKKVELKMIVKYKKELYSANVLFRACYKFTDSAYVHLDTDEENYIVSVSSKTQDDAVDYAKEFSNQMIEEANREIVIEQTKNIRQILFARSMASTVVYDDEIADLDTDVEDKSAMKDWFENE